MELQELLEDKRFKNLYEYYENNQFKDVKSNVEIDLLFSNILLNASKLCKIGNIDFILSLMKVDDSNLPIEITTSSSLVYFIAAHYIFKEDYPVDLVYINIDRIKGLVENNSAYDPSLN